MSENTKRPFFQSLLLRNWPSLAGLVVALSSIFAFVLLLILDFFAKDESPYLGILTYLEAVSEQHRPQGFCRLFPLPRRPTRLPGRQTQDHRPINAKLSPTQE